LRPACAFGYTAALKFVEIGGERPKLSTQTNTGYFIRHKLEDLEGLSARP
jgi:hypothetical protein